ncbi:NIPSNAP family protein [Amphiplicatus metriothermophilus]|uniref:NIPSNAP protein n=1 Tax=Amphiplicatus metriothermophilus TaxID=1519374 RepID=A0A239PK20_9PROT|nr:NIPSNAP family protein [Amphiplicatus metriothermophilus]MBB5517679.1 heme-degrading monooxygenase HmoA [Amphiplicatus metriothermophilus]SNT67987.1 NIPSNAP protein [Amphiplicatus metriothermophilus]
MLSFARRVFLAFGLAAAAVLAAGAARAEGSPVHQLRIYEIFEENKQAFHERFRDHAARIMKRHGFDIVAMWEAKGEDGTEFVYLLAWPDEETMRARWTAFMADAEWAAIKRETGAVYGRLVGAIEDRVLRLTDYSPVPAETLEGAR